MKTRVIKLTPAQRIVLMFLSKRTAYTERRGTDDTQILRSFLRRGIVRRSNKYSFQFYLTEFGGIVKKLDGSHWG